MDLTSNILLPLLLVAIVANTAIIAVLFVTGRLGRDKRIAATSARGATMDQALLSESYVDHSAAAAWSTSEPDTDDASADQEPDAMPDETPDLTVVPVVNALHGADGAGTDGHDAASSAQATGGVDAMTGLADASAFARLVGDEDARVQRYRRAATIVIFELDGLERLVARLGPEAGDRVVPALADTIRRLARSADHVARLGPGRFAVLLPETDEVAAINYVERVRRACELWLESGAMAMHLAIGWAGTTGDPSLPDAQRIATDRMYVELRRSQRRADPVADAAPASPAAPAAAAPAPAAAVAPAPVAPAAPFRTESEDDIPS